MFWKLTRKYLHTLYKMVCFSEITYLNDSISFKICNKEFPVKCRIILCVNKHVLLLWCNNWMKCKWKCHWVSVLHRFCQSYWNHLAPLQGLWLILIFKNEAIYIFMTTCLNKPYWGLKLLICNEFYWKD